MRIEIEIPDPPEGWVFDGFRAAVSSAEKWHDGTAWCAGPSVYNYPIAVKAKPLWEPSPELLRCCSLAGLHEMSRAGGIGTRASQSKILRCGLEKINLLVQLSKAYCLQILFPGTNRFSRSENRKNETQI